MNMAKNYVIDTTSLISYFDKVFKEKPKISRSAIRIIGNAFKMYSEIKLSIPSIVFIEIFDKWYSDEEMAAKIKIEIMNLIMERPNIEIKPIEKEVLENFLKIKDKSIKIDNHDKIILASSMMLQWPLITSDSEIIKYNRKHGVIPFILN
jgi:PIN domain nuclease of toxin-antitoxin system